MRALCLLLAFAFVACDGPRVRVPVRALEEADDDDQAEERFCDREADCSDSERPYCGATMTCVECLSDQQCDDDECCDEEGECEERVGGVCV